MSQYYLLLENQQDGLKQLYSGAYKKPHVDYLFAQTELAGLKEHSPIIAMDVEASHAILQETLQKNSGWIITTEHAYQDLLAHLRYILLVYINTEQTGIFRYYDPIITQYFFTSLNETDTAVWLGPIKQIEWFSNTWRNKVLHDNQWQSCYNSQAEQWQHNPQKLTNRLSLEPRHHQILQTMQVEKFAYHWLQNSKECGAGSDIDKTIDWIRQGINIGLWQDKELIDYLTIRAAHPDRLLPEQWPGRHAQERLDYLAHYFKQTHRKNSLLKDL